MGKAICNKINVFSSSFFVVPSKTYSDIYGTPLLVSFVDNCATIV